jgi:hypothetical protein
VRRGRRAEAVGRDECFQVRRFGAREARRALRGQEETTGREIGGFEIVRGAISDLRGEGRGEGRERGLDLPA